MSTKVYLSSLDAAVNPHQATISVFDRGFLYGDSVYETMRTYRGKPIDFDRHMQRLRRSADRIGLELPFSAEKIGDAIAQTHRESGNSESYVRVMVTRGTGPIALDPRASEDPTLVVIVKPLELPTDDAYERGIHVVIVDIEKGTSGLDPTIKTGNYLSNILALRQAIARGGDDALLKNSAGDIAEGATSNVFLVSAAHATETIHTPDLSSGLLGGITRQRVCEIARSQGIAVVERSITPDELFAAREVFLTSSVRGIMPVTRIDGCVVGDGTVGSVTRRLRWAYQAAIEAS